MAQLTPDETLLGLLAIHPMHGYELLDCFRDPARLGHVWTLSTSQLYAVLRRLEAHGLTHGQEVRSTEGPTRIEYAITVAGEDRLQRWLDEPRPGASIRAVRVEFLSRLFIAQQLARPLDHLVQAQKHAVTRQIVELSAELDQTEPGIERLALELHIAQLSAVNDWIDRCALVERTE